MANETKKPNEILLLEEVANEILKDKNQDYILLGKKNYFRPSGKSYDFLFHAIKGIPLDRIEPEPFLVVPVFSYECPAELDQVRVAIYEANKINGSIELFASRDKKTKVVTCRGKEDEKSGFFFKFFDIKKLPVGLEINNREDYLTANEQDFSANYSDWKDIRKELDNLRLRMDKKYS